MEAAAAAKRMAKYAALRSMYRTAVRPGFVTRHLQE